MKKVAFAAAVLGLALAFPAVTVAQTGDDKKWIDKCVKDNKDEGAKASVVRAYCACMNEKMDDNETLSISAWEKKNPKAMKECEKKSGWK